MSKTLLERPAHGAAAVTGGFWGEKLQKIRDVTVRDILHKFETDHQEGIMKNYEWVIEGKAGEHVGPPWYDGLICEVIRGVSDFIALSYDEELDRKIEFYASMIEKAQSKDPDGYIDTYTTLMCPEQRWGENGGSLIWQHNTYNMGCLIEAGIHYYRATGKTILLRCAVKAANCLCGVIGPAPKKNIVPAHSLAEEAVVKLHRLLKETPGLTERLAEEGVCADPEAYLSLACFWIDHRGVHENRASMPRYMGEYAQDHCRVSEQSEAVGHAVRAALFYTGLTAAGIETENESYLAAASRLWENVEKTKLHISGGIGAVHNEERFGYQYDLPNDAYLETCAGVALAFWAGEMHRAFGESRYMDVLECALYNNVLPCLSADGTRYFYENPLISDGTVERWDWHGCPCCPPMFLKLMGALPDYIYSLSREGLFINLPISSTFRGEVKGQSLSVSVSENLPFDGKVKAEVSLNAPFRFTLALRVPAWAGKTVLRVNGEEVKAPLEKGYRMIERVWEDGDRAELEMELPAVKVEAHPYVDADAGRVALWRGPFLYCLEEADNPAGTDPVLGEDPLTAGAGSAVEETVVLRGKTAAGEGFTAVPYYLWNNRGKGRMNVWVRQTEGGSIIANGEEGAHVYAAHSAAANAKKTCLDGWEGKLYRRRR